MKNLSNNYDEEMLSKAFFDMIMQDSFLLEWLPCAAYLIKDDPDLTIIRGNALFYELFGCTEESMRHRYAGRLSALISADSLSDLTALGQSGTGSFAAFRQHIKRAAEMPGSILRLSIIRTRRIPYFAAFPLT